METAPDTLNLRHLRVLVEAVRSGSVSVAAARCNLSQPAATQALAGLARALQAPLLVRSAGALLPSEAGTRFAKRAETALEHLAQGARVAGRGKTGRNSLETQTTAAQLRALIAIANTGSFTLAARALSVSQPTIHRAARTLEAQADRPFFTATAVGVDLSAAAQAYVLAAKRAYADLRQGIEEVGELHGQRSSRFDLGSLPLARTAIVPDAVNRIVSDNPDMQIRVVDGRYGPLLRALREGDLDCLIGALRTPPPADDVVQEPLFDDPLALVAHPSHPLFQASAPGLEDTLAFPWIAPPRDTPAGSYLYEVLQIQNRARTPVRVVSSSLIMLRELLRRGPYISIISLHQIREERAAGHILPLPIRLSDNTRTIGLTTRAGWRPTKAQSQVLDALRDSSDSQTQNSIFQ